MEMAERPPYIQFETRAIEDRDATIAAGHYVARDVDYVLITPPGSKDCVERIASEWLAQTREQAKKGKINPKLAEAYEYAYKQWKEENTLPEFGTPIRGWPLISPAQQGQILAANVRTVEDLAALNESGLSRIGMGSRDLQNKAKAWLQSANDTGKTAAENAALKVENEQLKERIASLDARLVALEAQTEAAPRRRKAANE